jgi:hypothetical protein
MQYDIYLYVVKDRLGDELGNGLEAGLVVLNKKGVDEHEDIGLIYQLGAKFIVRNRFRVYLHFIAPYPVSPCLQIHQELKPLSLYTSVKMLTLLGKGRAWKYEVNRE